MQDIPALVRKEDGKPVRVLLVDDSVFARRNLAKMVESFGMEVVAEAGDGSTAITEHQRVSPDLALMDVTMPQMEGIEAVARIMKQCPQARIVMVSSVGYEENILSALQRGARHFVQKPVKPEVLYDIVRYVMADVLAEAPTVAAAE
jgi:two-component system chemotaxis response regulator CheY